jgi:hypothetical protein
MVTASAWYLTPGPLKKTAELLMDLLSELSVLLQSEVHRAIISAVFEAVIGAHNKMKV